MTITNPEERVKILRQYFLPLLEEINPHLDFIKENIKEVRKSGYLLTLTKLHPSPFGLAKWHDMSLMFYPYKEEDSMNFLSAYLDLSGFYNGFIAQRMVLDNPVSVSWEIRRETSTFLLNIGQNGLINEVWEDFDNESLPWEEWLPISKFQNTMISLMQVFQTPLAPVKNLE